MADWQQAEVISKHSWNQRLFSLRLNADLKPFEPGQFIKVGLDINGERVERPYSLANPLSEPAEILFNIVPAGPLTPELARLEAGDRLWVTRNANGFLILNQVPEVRDLWMMATGTGVGPFVSMLKSPEVKRFDHLVLVHGVRSRDELAYREDLEALAERLPFSYLPIVSREEQRKYLNGRITDHIDTGVLETAAGIQLSSEHSHVLLCGSYAMIKDVQDLLIARGMKKHKRFDPGHISMEKYH